MYIPPLEKHEINICNAVTEVCGLCDKKIACLESTSGSNGKQFVFQVYYLLNDDVCVPKVDGSQNYRCLWVEGAIYPIHRPWLDYEKVVSYRLMVKVPVDYKVPTNA